MGDIAAGRVSAGEGVFPLDEKLGPEGLRPPHSFDSRSPQPSPVQA